MTISFTALTSWKSRSPRPSGSTSPASFCAHSGSRRTGFQAPLAVANRQYPCTSYDERHAGLHVTLTLTSASVGDFPTALNTVPSSLVVMQPGDRRSLASMEFKNPSPRTSNERSLKCAYHLHPCRTAKRPPSAQPREPGRNWQQLA